MKNLDELKEILGAMHIQHVEHLNVGGDNMTVYNGTVINHAPQAEAKADAAPADDDAPADEPLVQQLAPIFFGSDTEASVFVARARTMKPTGITQLVAQLVVKKTISDKSYGRDLWKLLHDNGIYTKSETNWNQQVRENLPVKR